MATRAKLNWKVLHRLLPMLEQEGWSHAQIAADWGISLTTLEGHLTQEVTMQSKHDYEALTEELERRLASGESRPTIQAEFEARGVHWRTFMNRRSQLNKVHRSTPEEHPNIDKVHLSTPEEPELWTEHQSTPEPTESLEHRGTLEGHQEVIADVSESGSALHVMLAKQFRATVDPNRFPRQRRSTARDGHQRSVSTVSVSQVPEKWPHP
jgi:hypothetical protein